MNTLDRVILMYNGVWPEFDWNDSEFNQNAIVETIEEWYNDDSGKVEKVGAIDLGGTAVDPKYCRVICTKEQFEQRVLELNKEKQMTDWYDYEKKTAITFPPVGSDVIAYTREITRDFWPDHHLVKVIAIDGDNIVYKYQDEYYSNGLYAFKPLDWEKDVRKDKLIDKAVQIMYDNACATKGELINGVKRLYDLGYLKFPEDK